MGWVREVGAGGVLVWINTDTGEHSYKAPNETQQKKADKHNRTVERHANRPKRVDKDGVVRGDYRGEKKGDGTGYTQTKKGKRQWERHLSDAKRQRIEEAAAAQERQARIEARTARMAAKAEKRGKRIVKRLEKKSADLQAKIDAGKQKVGELQRAALDASASGNYAEARLLQQQAQDAAERVMGLEQELNEANSGVVRALEAERLKVKAALDAENLTGKQKREIRAEWRDTKEEQFESSATPALSRARYSPRKAGDSGRAKELQAALRELRAIQVADPSKFDPEAMAWVLGELDKHDTAVKKNQDFISNRLENNVAALEKHPYGSPKWKAALERARKNYKELNGEDIRREMRLLYGPILKTDKKGNPIKKNGKYITQGGKKISAAAAQERGLLWESAITADLVYTTYEDWYWKQAFTQPDGTFTAEDEKAMGEARVEAEATHRLAERSRQWITDPVTGKRRKQTTEERLAELQEADREKARKLQEAGYQYYQDYDAAAATWRDNPYLSPLADILEREDIHDNIQLTGTYGVERREDIIKEATDTAWENIAAGPDYAVPGVAEGIYDPSRYGEDERGRFFVSTDGKSIYMGGPMPQGHPEPRWDLDAKGPDVPTEIVRGAVGILGAIPTFGGSLVLAQNIDFDNSFSRALDHAKNDYDHKTKQAIEDAIRQQMGVTDPGFLGDIFRQNAVGEIIATPDIIPGVAAYQLRKTLNANVGTSFFVSGNYGRQRELERLNVESGLYKPQEPNEDGSEPSLRDREKHYQWEEHGIYDYDRYHLTPEGAQSFTYPDGTTVIQGDEIPEGWPEPKWNRSGDPTKPIWERFATGEDAFAKDLEAWKEYDWEREFQKNKDIAWSTIPSQYRELDMNKSGDYDDFQVVYWKGGRPDRDAQKGTGNWFADAVLSLGLGSDTIIARGPDGEEYVSTIIYTPVFGAIEFATLESKAISESIAQAGADAEDAWNSGDWGIVARVLGSNEILHFGNIAGAMNFAWYMMGDVTNFIPGMTFAKKGLAGIRAMSNAQNVPGGLRKMAFYAGKFKTGFMADPHKEAQLLSVRKQLGAFKPGASEEEIFRGLKESLGDIDPTKGENIVDQWARSLSKRFGLDALGIDHRQVRAFAERNIQVAFEHRGWIIRTQTQDALAHMRRMEELVEVRKAEQTDIEKAVVARQRRYLEMMGDEGEGGAQEFAKARHAEERAQSDAFEQVNTIMKNAVDRDGNFSSRKANAQLRRLKAALGQSKDGSPANMRLKHAIRMLEERLKATTHGVMQGDLSPPGREADRTFHRGGQLLSSRRVKSRKGLGARRDAGKTDAELSMTAKKERDEMMRRKDRDAARKAMEARMRTAEARKRAKAQEAHNRQLGRVDDIRRYMPQELQRLIDHPGLKRFLNNIPNANIIDGGASFWTPILRRTQQAGRFVDDMVADGLEMARTTAMRYGRFSLDDAGTKAWYNYRFREFLQRTNFKGREWRGFYLSVLEQNGVFPHRGSQRWGERFTVDPTGTKIINERGHVQDDLPASLHFDNFTESMKTILFTDGAFVGADIDIIAPYIRGLSSGRITAGDAAEAAFEFYRSMIANPNFTSGDGLNFLRQMQRLERNGLEKASDAAKVQLRVMFEDELMNWRYRAAEAQTQSRTAWADEMNKESIGELHRVLFENTDWEVTRIMTEGGFANKPGTGVKRGFSGRTIPQALERLEKAVQEGSLATREFNEALDDLARAMLYEQMGPNDWKTTQEVVRILRAGSARSNTGRVAKALRARIETELDMLGFDDPARVRVVDVDDLPATGGDIRRVYRGIGGSVTRGPQSFTGTAGAGGQVWGPGVYAAVSHNAAASYANGGVVASLLYKQSETLDMRYFVDTTNRSSRVTLGDQIRAARAKTFRRGDPAGHQHRKMIQEYEKFEKFFEEFRRIMKDEKGVDIPDMDMLTFNEFWSHISDVYSGRAGRDAEEFLQAMQNTGLKGMAVDIANVGSPRPGVNPSEVYVFSPINDYFKVENFDVAQTFHLEGLEAATVATAQAKAIQNEFGMSELDWLRQRARRTAARINNPTLSEPVRRALLKEQEKIQAAIVHVEVEKGAKRYVMPKTTMDEAMKGAESVRERVKGIIPEKLYSFYAENGAQVATEVMRSVWRNIKEARVHVEAYDPEIDRIVTWFPFQEWKGLNDEVGLAVQQVQGKRMAPLNRRKLKTTDDETPEILQTVRDQDPAVVAAKQEAITNWLAAHNINETLTVEQYDRMRTILQKHVQKGTRTELLIEEARQMPGDFRENLLKLRAQKVEDMTVQHVAWTMIENPGMTVEEATRQLELGWAGDGRYREPPQQITQSDHDLLIAFFEQNTGVRITDQPGVTNVLQSNGTLPPMDLNFAFKQHMRLTGEWAPKALDEIDDEHVWSLAEQYDFFMTQYGMAPAWVTDARFKPGPNGEPPMAFVSRENYFQTQLDVGSYDQQLQVRRTLGEELVPDYEALSVGVEEDGVQIIKPAKDVAVERRWMVDMYGEAVGTYNADGTVTLTAAPWLMNLDELRAWRVRISGVTDLQDMGALILKEEELTELQWVIGELAEKYVDQWIKASGTIVHADYPPVIPSSVVHRISFDMVRELSTTQAWRGVWRHFRNRNILDAWGAFWRAVVISSPAFIVSNVIDTPSKALWFSLTDRWSVRPTQKWVEAIEGVESLGIGGSAFFYDVNKRSILDRIRPSTTYGRMDQLGGFWDLATNALARNILQPVEQTMKTDVARRIATGLDEELRPILRRQGHSERVIDQLILIQTKERILKLFPSLDNAGFAERLLNKVFPFISYNFKNKVLWTTEVIEHPWIIPLVNEMQEMLVEYNTVEWQKDHPGEPVPEHLMHKIRIPGTDMFIDLGMFTDSARGAAPIMGDYETIGDFFNGFIRPLPAQMAFAQKVGWDLFGLFGRERWEKVLDEHGIHTGEYKKVIVPPGTPWGDRPMDYLKDLLWPVNFAQVVQKTLEDGTITGAEAVRIIGALVSFGEFGTPSRYFQLNATYRALMDVSKEAAMQWLKTEDGQELKDLWAQNWHAPTDTKLPWAAFNANEMENASPETFRKAWLSTISPETRQKMFSAWEQSRKFDDMWDAEIDGVYNAEERGRLWTLRRTFFHQFYVSRPYLWVYEGFTLSPEELAEKQMRLLLDEKRNTFMSLYSYALAPDDAEARAQWEKERAEWLDANPDLRADLAAVKDTWDLDTKLDQEAMTRAIEINARIDNLREAAFAAGDEKLAAEFQSWRKTQQYAFERERFGFDSDAGENGQFRFEQDNLSNRLMAAAGSKTATKKVLYGQRMAAVVRDTKGDPLKFWKTMNRHPDLREQYWENNPEQRKNWQQRGEYLMFWRDMDKLADSGKWDEYWRNWDRSPQWVKDMFKENNPSGYKSFVTSFRYQHYMGTWVAFFDRGDNAGAARYWDSLPQWVKDRYYANHPGKRLSSGRGSAYVSGLNQVFDAIDAGDWDKAERIWKSLPAWMRRRYYSNNPDSTLFRGGQKRGSGGGISDAKYKKYIRAMKKWVDLQKDGKDGAADDYFRSLPKWMQDFYLKRHPDKALLKEDMEIQSLVEEYLIANPEAQKAMLQNSPKLRRWLAENDSKFARRAAIQFVYSRLPDDPWLKRVFREKYPEIFSKEAKGKEYKQRTFDILQDNPDLVGPWKEWYEDIFKTMQDALKWMSPRPKQIEVERPDPRRKEGTGLSAEEVEERGRVRGYVERNMAMKKRLPKLDSTV